MAGEERKWLVGERVAIVRVSDGAVLKIATVDKVGEREIRTNTPVEHHDRMWESPRRFWRVKAPHAQLRAPTREEAGSLFIRPASLADIAEADRRAAVRKAKARMPNAIQNRDEYARQIEQAERTLRSLREPYERLLAQIAEDEALIAAGGEP